MISASPCFSRVIRDAEFKSTDSPTPLDELDESGQIESLYAFIENNGNYEKIDEVVDKYNSLIEKRTKDYNDKINTLNKNIEEKINESINRDTLDTLYNNLSDLYDEANPYSLDENLSDNFKKLQGT